LTKEAFQKVLGDYGNHFEENCQMMALAHNHSNCCYFDGHEQVRSDCRFVPKESKGEMPVAIIQNGTTAAEKVGIGTINTIQSVVAEQV
jgi:siroheme synthase